MINETNSYQISLWKGNETFEALRLLAKLVAREMEVSGPVRCETKSFRIMREADGQSTGMYYAVGEIVNKSCLRLSLEILHIPKNVVLPEKFIRTLCDIFAECPCINHSDSEKDKYFTGIWVEMACPDQPIGLARANRFREKFRKLQKQVELLQAEIPEEPLPKELSKIFKSFPDVLNVVEPLTKSTCSAIPSIRPWLDQTLELLSGNCTVALVSEYSSITDFIIAALATVAIPMNMYFGQVKTHQLTVNNFLELAIKAPGIITMPAIKLVVNSNMYEMENISWGLLASLKAAGRPALFTGSYEDLQKVFSGGQGGVCDPLHPVVCRVPEIPLEPLTAYIVGKKAARSGGLHSREIERITNEVVAVLSSFPPDSRARHLPIITGQAVHQAVHSGSGSRFSLSDYAGRLDAITETLGGLNSTNATQRLPDVQKKLATAFTDRDFLPFLKRTILGQDEALVELVTRMQSEILARPMQQPVRVLLQGTSGTAKSMSAKQLAKWLGIPYINIDTASMADDYTATAQLLGSGRGLVGSHQSGRLEQAAKHHRGAVVEVSDLDHAPLRARSKIADIFLQVLENGEAQTATGAIFSCANLIFVFTINLPGNRDEKVRTRYGFGSEPGHDEVKRRVQGEAKEMFSNAFLGRVGTPILFPPLSRETLLEIAEKVIRETILSSAQRLGFEHGRIHVSTKACQAVLHQAASFSQSLGARVVLQQGRDEAIRSVLELSQKGWPGQEAKLLVTSTGENRLQIESTID